MISGLFLIVLCLAAGVIGAGVFTAKAVTPFWGRLGFLCFFGCIPALAAGAILIVLAARSEDKQGEG